MRRLLAPRPPPVRTLLCAIARDEDAYLGEWIDHHLRIGFERIVVYDHESVRPAAEATPAHARARVEVRPWRSRAGVAPQLAAYADCLRRDGRTTDWLMFLDLDEFLNLRRHPGVGAFVEDHGDVDGVAVNWRVFGSAGLAAPDGRPVLERFTRASQPDFEPNIHVKTIFRPRAAKAVGVHCPRLRRGARLVNTRREPAGLGPDGYQPNPDYQMAQVNHYFVKSRAEWVVKRARGRADMAPGAQGALRADALFAAYDRNEVEDLSIRRWFDPAAQG